MPPDHEQDPDEAYEEKHVHQVYQQIAEHFSSTRYKVHCQQTAQYTGNNKLRIQQPWPIVERFLLAQPPGSVGLDIGCGNGKYLSVNRDIFIVASDRYPNLLANDQRNSKLMVF